MSALESEHYMRKAELSIVLLRFILDPRIMIQRFAWPPAASVVLVVTHPKTEHHDA